MNNSITNLIKSINRSASVRFKGAQTTTCVRNGLFCIKIKISNSEDIIAVKNMIDDIYTDDVLSIEEEGKTYIIYAIATRDMVSKALENDPTYLAIDAYITAQEILNGDE